MGKGRAAAPATAPASQHLLACGGAANCLTPPPAPRPQVSGKVWKAAGFKAGTYKSEVVGTSWEKKMAAKAAKKQFTEQKKAAVESLRAKRKVGLDGGGGGDGRRGRGCACVPCAGAPRLGRSGAACGSSGRPPSVGILDAPAAPA
jgi:hypothetical protein